MRILDNESDRKLNRITIYLTVLEAQEMRDSLASLLSNKATQHEHVSNEDFQKEVTITIYDSHSIESYDQRSRRLIEHDV